MAVAHGGGVVATCRRSLEDAPRPGRLKTKYSSKQLEPCQALLKPVYTEYMVPVYKPPKSHGCSRENRPLYDQDWRKNREDQSTRVYSQCKRLELADDYISQVYEPKVGFQYSAVIRARPDDIFLRDVPPLPSYNLSRFTVAAGGIADHWHVVHRGCRMAPPECIHCKDAVNDTSCGSYGVYDLDTRVHPVLAREEPSSYFLKKRIRLPSRPRGKSSSAGYLHLECQRWRDRLAKNAPVAYEQLRGLNLCDLDRKPGRGGIASNCQRTGRSKVRSRFRCKVLLAGN
eukprot:g10287.t1